MRAADRLAELSRQVPEWSGSLAHLWSFRHSGPELDRTVAIVAASLVEHALRLEIEKRMVPGRSEALFDHNREGPLASWTNRLRVAYALGVFGEQTYADLKLMAKVRNAMAHSVETISFTNADVMSLCSALKLPEFFDGPLEEGGAKHRFLSAAIGITHFLRGPSLRLTSNGLHSSITKRELP